MYHDPRVHRTLADSECPNLGRTVTEPVVCTSNDNDLIKISRRSPAAGRWPKLPEDPARAAHEARSAALAMAVWHNKGGATGSAAVSAAQARLGVTQAAL